MEPHVVRDAGRGAAIGARTRRHGQRGGARPGHRRRWPGNWPSKQLEKVYAVEHELLEQYTPDAYSLALRGS